MKECPKPKHNQGRLFTLGSNEAINDPTVVTGTFLINNSYASVLFDCDADRSFVSHKYKQLLKQNPQSLQETYTVEMANGLTEGSKEIFLN